MKPSWYPSDGTAVAPQKAEPRSRVSKGKKSFEVGDGRSRWARRFRDLLDGHVADLGGPLVVTPMQVAMCRRIATITVECERLEGQLSLDEPIDFDLYNRLSSNLKRLCETIGVKPTPPKDEPLPLDEYLAKKRAGLVE